MVAGKMDPCTIIPDLFIEVDEEIDPITNSELEKHETTIGFTFPHLFRQVYLTVGDGGFAELLPISEIVRWYTSDLHHWQAPPFRDYFPIASVGCGMSLDLHKSLDDGPIVLNNNCQDLIPHCDSLSTYFDFWLQGGNPTQLADCDPRSLPDKLA